MFESKHFKKIERYFDMYSEAAVKMLELQEDRQRKVDGSGQKLEAHERYLTGLIKIMKFQPMNGIHEIYEAMKLNPEEKSYYNSFIGFLNDDVQMGIMRRMGYGFEEDGIPSAVWRMTDKDIKEKRVFRKPSKESFLSRINI